MTRASGVRSRRLAAFAVVPVAAVSLVACGGGGGDSGSDSGFVSVGIGEPKNLLTTGVGETEGHQVINALYTPLVTYNDDLTTTLAAAESIEPSDGNKVWTIKLKPGWTFHNGEAVTADSYINAWNYGAYGPNAQDLNSYYSKIDGYDELNPTDGSTPPTDKLSGLKAVDDTTIEVTLDEPYAQFDVTLGYTNFLPLPSAAFADPDGFEQAPVGNGPFKMKGTWEHDVQISVEKWADYPGTQPQVDGIDFKIYQDASAQYNDVVGGNLDVIKTIPTEQIANAQSDLGDRYQTSEAGTFQALTFPEYDEDFSDVRVRRAISMAIDRETIVQTIFSNSQTAATSWVPAKIPGAVADTCGEWCTYNAAEAKTMYQEAGGPSELTISYNSDGGHKEWIDATCNQLNTNLGVTCTGNPVAKFADLLTQLQNKEAVGMFRSGWVPDYPTMDNYLEPLYSCDAVPAPNYGGYCDEEFDGFLSDGFEAADATAAQAEFAKAEALLAEDLPSLPMRFGKNNFGHSESVTNVKINFFYELDLFAIQKA